MTQLQKIVAKAKTLRKSYPKLKWTDLIKKASKLVTPAKKSVSGINKAVVKKYAPVKPLVKKRIETKSDFAMAGIKEKKAVKKSPARSMHKDTKSHNVRISVMSGNIGNITIDQIKKNNHNIEKLTNTLLKNKDQMKLPQFKTTFWKNWFVKRNKEINQYISTLKKQNTALKKHIK
jgi:predicted  nucleic acid-binding Zn-ribbon protein